MKICFSARPAYNKVSVALSRYFINNNIDISPLYVTNNIKQKRYLEKELDSNLIQVFVVSEYIEENWDEFTFKKFVNIEKEFDCNPLWKYIYTDRFLVNRNHEYVTKMTTGLFLFYKKIFSSTDIEYYYDETIATLQSYIAFIVGRKYNVKYLSQMVARGFDTTHHYFLNDPFQYICDFDSNYRKKIYSRETVYKAKKFLENFENMKNSPGNMVFVKKKPTINLKSLLIGLKFFFDREFHNKYDYMNYHHYKEYFHQFFFLYKYLLCKKYYQKPDFRKKYIYYPLHYQPEASSLVCAPKYEKQLYYIDSWAKSIPADTQLFIKEHYAQLGHRPLNFYKQLQKYPNVVIINPWADSFKLISNAFAITTLTGTAGWEAMLLRKPVILGGSIYFDNAPGVLKVGDIFDNYDSLIQRWKKPAKEELSKYLCEYITKIREGAVYFAHKSSFNEGNISKVANSLIDYIKNDF